MEEFLGTSYKKKYKLLYAARRLTIMKEELEFNHELKSSFLEDKDYRTNLINKSAMPELGLYARNLLNEKQMKRLALIRKKRLSNQNLRKFIQD